jgi:hypothetical protein
LLPFSEHFPEPEVLGSAESLPGLKGVWRGRHRKISGFGIETDLKWEDFYPNQTDQIEHRAIERLFPRLVEACNTL